MFSTYVLQFISIILLMRMFVLSLIPSSFYGISAAGLAHISQRQMFSQSRLGCVIFDPFAIELASS